MNHNCQFHGHHTGTLYNQNCQQVCTSNYSVDANVNGAHLLELYQKLQIEIAEQEELHMLQMDDLKTNMLHEFEIQLDNELRQYENKFQNTIRKQEAEISALNSHLNAFQKKIQAMQEDEQRYLSDNQQLTNQLQSERLKCKNITQEYQDLIKQMENENENKLQYCLKQKEAELKNVFQFEKTKLTQQIDELNKKIQEYSINFAKFNSTLEQLKDKLQQFKSSNDLLSIKVSQLEKLNYELSIDNKRITSLQPLEINPNKGLLKEIEDLKKQLNQKQVHIEKEIIVKREPVIVEKPIEVIQVIENIQYVPVEKIIRERLQPKQPIWVDEYVQNQNINAEKERTLSVIQENVQLQKSIQDLNNQIVEYEQIIQLYKNNEEEYRQQIETHNIKLSSYMEKDKINSQLSDYLDQDIPKLTDTKSLQAEIKTQNKSKHLISKTQPAQIIMPLQFDKLMSTQKEDIFLKFYDSNQHLKKHQKSLEKNIQELQNKITICQKEYKIITQDLSVDKINKETNQEYQQLQNENKLLKQRLKAIIATSKIVHKPRKLHKTLKEKQYKETPEDLARIQVLNREIDNLKILNRNNEKELMEFQNSINNQVFSQQDDIKTQAKLLALQGKYDQLELHQEVIHRQENHFIHKLQDLNQLVQKLTDENITFQLNKTELEQQIYASKDIKMEILKQKQQNQFQEQQIFAIHPIATKSNDVDQNIQDYEQNLNLKSKLQQTHKEVFQNQRKIQLEVENLKIQQKKQNLQISKIREDNQELQQEHETILLEQQNKKLQLNKQKEQQQTQSKKQEDPIWKKLEIYDTHCFELLKSEQNNQHKILKQLNFLYRDKAEIIQHLVDNTEKIQARQNNHANIKQSNEIELQKNQQELELLNQKNDQLQAIIEKMTIKQLDFWALPNDDDSNNLKIGENYLDLQINQLNIIDNQQSKLNKQQLFLIIDFYDHESKHTKIIQNLIDIDFDFLESFKVLCDQFFIKHLSQNCINLELYATKLKSQKQSELIGKGQIELLPLFQKLVDNEQVQVQAYVPIYQQNDYTNMIATIDFKMRIRYTIPQEILIKFTENEQVIDEDDDFAEEQRTLVIQIDKIETKSTNKIFMYYNFDNEDFTTTSLQGPICQFNFKQKHYFLYNKYKRHEFNDSSIEFVIFDDSENDKEDKVLAVYQQPLKKLNVLNQTIKETYLINSIKFDIYIYWELETQKVINKPTNYQKIFQQIVIQIKNRCLTLDNVFHFFDIDDDELVSFDDFEKTIRGTLNIDINRFDTQNIYKQLTENEKTPLNELQFKYMFKDYLIEHSYVQVLNQEIENQEKKREVFNQKSQITEAMSMQKQLDIICTQIEKYMEFNKFHMHDLFEQIDKNNSNTISYKEFQLFLTANINMEIPIQCVQQLFQYFDSDSSGFVSLKEFYQLIEPLISFKQRQQLNNNQQSEQILDKIHDVIKKNKKILSSEFKKLEKSVYYISTKDFINLIQQVSKNTILNQETELYIQEYTEKDFQGNINYQKILIMADPLDHLQNLSKEKSKEILRQVKQSLSKNKNELVQIFRKLDKNMDKTLSQEELYQAMSSIGLNSQYTKQQMLSVCENLDKDNDGKLNYDEFLEAIQFD